MHCSYKIKLLLLLGLIPICLPATNLDSLVRSINETDKVELEEIASNLLSVGKIQLKQKNHNAALKSFTKVIEYTHRSSLHAEAYFQIGKTYQKLEQHKLALENYLETLRPQLIQHHKNIAQVYTPIANSYLALGEYEKAYDYQIRVLEIAENNGVLKQQGKVLYEIGTIFYYQDKFPEALTYYKKSLVLCEQLKNNQLISTCLGAMGSCYGQLGEIEQSLHYNQRYLALAQQVNYQPGIAYGLHNIASNYVSQTKYGIAMQTLERSLSLKKELNDKWGMISGLELIAEIYTNQHQLDLALTTLDKALAIALEINAKPRLQDLHKAYVDIYSIKGDYKKAYQHLKSHIDIKDSIINAESLEEMADRKSRYEIHKRETEILSLKKDKTLLEKDQQIDLLYKISFGIIIFLLAVIIGIFYNRYRLQRQNFDLLEDKNEQIRLKNEALQQANANQLEITHLLAEKNELLNHHNAQIEKSNQRLSAMNLELQHFTSVASHDLKEPLRMIGSYTSILKRRYIKNLDVSAQEFMGYITDATARMQALLDDLLSYSRAGSQRMEMEQVDLNDTLTIVHANLHHQLLDAGATLKVYNENLPAIQGSSTQMIQLFQNLVSNGVKFSGERKPVVQIKCTEQARTHLIQIKDNGIGIPLEYQDKIFEMFQRLHNHNEYEGTGIGLATCKKIVERHAGKIWVDSIVGQGSTFNIELPKLAA